jgi:hypothetical protein
MQAKGLAGPDVCRFWGLEWSCCRQNFFYLLAKDWMKQE